MATEKIVIVAEVKQESSEPQHEQTLTAQITEQIFNAIGIPPDVVVLIPPQTIPKTSSGKLRRSYCKTLYMEGKLTEKPPALWTQVVRLWGLGFGQKSKRLANTIASVFYTGYVAVILGLTVFPLWLLTWALPPEQSRRWLPKWARVFLRLIGCPLRIVGTEHWPAVPGIVVVNHASYLDIVALLAALPEGIAFVAKQELMRTWMLRTFLNKQQTILVNRQDFASGILDAQHIEKTLQHGRSVVIFPEATFTRAAGIRPFKLGAFKISMETKSPICPVAIQGMRHILPADQWLMRRGKITVTIMPCLRPQSKDFAEMIRLRDQAREAIARQSHEPVLHLPAAGVSSHDE